VELGALEMEGLARLSNALFTSAESTEILSGLGDGLAVEALEIASLVK
jgi:hypothetical protein